MMMQEAEQDERQKVCHCGNPTDFQTNGHCLLCRCDEHGGSLETMAMPGCGPRCTSHPENVRQIRYQDLLHRTFEELPPHYTPAVQRTYHPWSEISRRAA